MSAAPLGSFGFSLVAFEDAERIRRFDREFSERFGREGLYELSYTTPADVLGELGFLRGRVVSGHAPCPPAELFPNLGSRDAQVAAESLETIRRSAATAAAFGARVLVLHPGYTTDDGVPSDTQRRLASLAASPDGEERSWLWLEAGSICRCGYCASPQYRVHLSQAIENLREASRLCAGQGVRLAVENLNPRLTYLFQLPEELTALAREIPEIVFCVDLGHLWISSLAHGFEFLQGLRDILATGRVVSVHVHDNPSTLGPPPLLADDHTLIGSGRVPIGEALSVLAHAGSPRLIIESKAPALENGERLLRLIAETAGGEIRA